MWERAQLKQRAKSVLKGSYWKAFLVSIVMGIVSSGSNSIGSRQSSNSESLGGVGASPESMFAIIVGVLVIMAVVIAISVAVQILIGYHLQVGGRRYFIQAAQGDVDMGNLGYGFKKGRYVGIIKTTFWKDLIVFLWSLLLIVPGIIKAYAYKMVPYILADNPQIGSKRALELSNQMTKGHKLDIFILELSFIGWYLLGILACFVGMIFVVPYQYSTEAELYLVLREQVIENGLADYKELNLVKRVEAIEAIE